MWLLVDTAAIELVHELTIIFESFARPWAGLSKSAATSWQAATSKA